MLSVELSLVSFFRAFGARLVSTLVLLLVACGPAPAAESAADRSAGSRGETDPQTQSPVPSESNTTEQTSEPGTANDARTAAEAIGNPSNGATPVATPDTAPSLAPLPEGTTVLQIGDSFAGALGIDLNRELKAAGVRGVLKYQTATYIPTWASSKDLEQYLFRYHPDLVLITLGANELEIPDPEQRAPTIRKLVARLGERPCVWIAPPLWKGARAALLDTIRANCAPCVYLDSSALVPDLARARDRIHPAMAARKGWAEAVLGWLEAHRVPNGTRPWEMKE